jgi:hypothetical protein
MQDYGFPKCSRGSSWRSSWRVPAGAQELLQSFMQERLGVYRALCRSACRTAVWRAGAVPRGGGLVLCCLARGKIPRVDGLAVLFRCSVSQFALSARYGESRCWFLSCGGSVWRCTFAVGWLWDFDLAKRTAWKFGVVVAVTSCLLRVWVAGGVYTGCVHGASCIAERTVTRWGSWRIGTEFDGVMIAHGAARCACFRTSDAWCVVDRVACCCTVGRGVWCRGVCRFPVRTSAPLRYTCLFRMDGACVCSFGLQRAAAGGAWRGCDGDCCVCWWHVACTCVAGMVCRSSLRMLLRVAGCCL